MKVTPADSSTLAFKDRNTKAINYTPALCPQSETYFLHMFIAIKNI